MLNHLSTNIRDNYGPLIPIMIGVTGHRDLLKEHVPALEQKVSDLLTELKQLYPTTPMYLLSPLAEGADRLVARVALQCGLKLVVPLPMEIEKYIQDFASPESQSEFKQLLANAEDSYVISTKMADGITGLSERQTCYRRLGLHMAKYSNILISLWNGVDSGAEGSTDQVVKFRLEGATGLAAPWLSHFHTAGGGAVYHVVTSRLSNPKVHGEIASTRWLFPNDFEEYKLASITTGQSWPNILPRNGPNYGHFSSLNVSYTYYLKACF
jgi:hypothetical protein